MFSSANLADGPESSPHQAAFRTRERAPSGNIDGAPAAAAEVREASGAKRLICLTLVETRPRLLAASDCLPRLARLGSSSRTEAEPGLTVSLGPI